MFTAISKIIAKSEASLRIKKSLTEMVKDCRCQKDCEKFILYEATDNPNLYMIYQTWRSEDAFDAHFNSEVVKNWGEKNRPLIKSWRVFFLKEII